MNATDPSEERGKSTLPEQHEQTSRARVLVIDDDPVVHSWVKHAVTQRAWTVDRALSLGDARKRLSDPYDVFVLDLRLGGENGIDLLGPILVRRPPVAVIVLSGQGVLEEANEIGQWEVPYLTKPATREQFIAAVDAELALVRVIRSLGLLGLDAVRARLEVRQLLAAMRETDGNRTEVARILGIPRTRVYLLLERYGLDDDDSEDDR